MITKDLLDKIKGYDLYNNDLAPFPYEKRTITPFGLGATWFGLSVTLAAFMLFAQFMQWLTITEMLWAATVGYIILAMIGTLTQEIGIIYGISLPATLRAQFGYAGSKVMSVIKLPSAGFWAGFNTYLGGTALNEVFKLTTGFDSILVAMIIFGAVSILIIFNAAEILAKFNAIVSPILLIIFAYIAILLFRNFDVNFVETFSMGGDDSLSFIGKLDKFMLCVMSAMGTWLGVSMAMQNITRECKAEPKNFNSWWQTNKKFSIGEFLGMAPPMIALGYLGGVSYVLTGEYNPIIVITDTVGAQSTAVAVICQIFICFAIWSTNGGANILTSAFLLCNIFKKANLRVMSIVFLIVVCLFKPWALTGFLPQVVTFLGSIVSPMCGIMIIDYYVIRKRKFSLDDMYRSDGKYHYDKGHNWGAWIAYIGSVLVMQIGPIKSYSLLIGLAISMVVYYQLMKFWVLKKHPEAMEEDVPFPEYEEEVIK